MSSAILNSYEIIRYTSKLSLLLDIRLLSFYFLLLHLHNWALIALVLNCSKNANTYLNGWIRTQCTVTKICNDCCKSLPSSKYRSVYAYEHRSLNEFKDISRYSILLFFF